MSAPLLAGEDGEEEGGGGRRRVEEVGGGRRRVEEGRKIVMIVTCHMKLFLHHITITGYYTKF